MYKQTESKQSGYLTTNHKIRNSRLYTVITTTNRLIEDTQKSFNRFFITEKARPIESKLEEEEKMTDVELHNDAQILKTTKKIIKKKGPKKELMEKNIKNENESRLTTVTAREVEHPEGETVIEAMELTDEFAIEKVVTFKGKSKYKNIKVTNKTD